MQAEQEYTRVTPHRLVQEFPAPLCQSCNATMWVIKRDGETNRRLNRFGYIAGACGETSESKGLSSSFSVPRFNSTNRRSFIVLSTSNWPH